MLSPMKTRLLVWGLALSGIFLISPSDPMQVAVSLSLLALLGIALTLGQRLLRSRIAVTSGVHGSIQHASHDRDLLNSSTYLTRIVLLSQPRC